MLKVPKVDFLNTKWTYTKVTCIITTEEYLREKDVDNFLKNQVVILIYIRKLY